MEMRAWVISYARRTNWAKRRPRRWLVHHNRTAALIEASTSSARKATAAVRTLASISASKRDTRWLCRRLTCSTIPLGVRAEPRPPNPPPSALRAHDFHRYGPDSWAIPEYRNGPFRIVKTSRLAVFAGWELEAAESLCAG